jgi:hypothetical protein
LGKLKVESRNGGVAVVSIVAVVSVVADAERGKAES